MSEMFYSNMTKRKWRRARGKIIAKFPNQSWPHQLRKMPYRYGCVFDNVIEAFLYPKPRNVERDEFEFGESHVQ